MKEKCPCGGSPPRASVENANHVRTFRDVTLGLCFTDCAAEFDRDPEQFMKNRGLLSESAQLELNLERCQDAARRIS